MFSFVERNLHRALEYSNKSDIPVEYVNVAGNGIIHNEALRLHLNRVTRKYKKIKTIKKQSNQISRSQKIGWMGWELINSKQAVDLR